MTVIMNIMMMMLMMIESTFEVVSPMRYTNPCLQKSWFNPGFVLLFSTNGYPPPGAPAPFLRKPPRKGLENPYKHTLKP